MLPGLPEDQTARRRLYDTARQIVQILYRAGMPLLAGTDEIPGTLADELELLVSAGLAPSGAPRRPRRKTAEFLRVSDAYGPIAPRRLANFVPVDLRLSPQT